MSALSICVALMNNDACRVLIEAKADLHAEDGFVGVPKRVP